MGTFKFHRSGKWIGKLIIGVAIGGAVCMLLWNALIPDLFHGPSIGYFQAVGLLVLTQLFFGRGGRMGGGYRRSDGWKQRFEEKLASMTPEEQEKFKAEWKKRCGYDA